MTKNFYVTGAPGSGKTTVLENTKEILEKEGYEVEGIYCPEIRSGRRREGFKIVDMSTGGEKILAHVEEKDGPKVGKYTVNVENVDEISREVISKGLERADVLMIDEIAPMEVYSDVFKEKVEEALDSDLPVLAVIHQRTNSGFIGRVKERDDAETYKVTKKNRDKLPKKLAKSLKKAFS